MSDRLDEIRARLGAATPGPWEARSKFSGKSSAVVSPAGDAELGNWMVAEGVFWSSNADFIAHAPTDIRYLLDAYNHSGETIKAYSENLTKAEAEIDRLRTLELEREKNLQRITELGQEIELLQRNHADGLEVHGVVYDMKADK